MAKIQVHVGGIVVLEVPDKFVSIDDEALTDPINDAYANIDTERLLDCIAAEFRIVGWASNNAEVDGKWDEPR